MTQYGVHLGNLASPESSLYTEIPESGGPKFRRVFNPAKFGWMQEWSLTKIIECYRYNLKAVMEGIDYEPTSLTTHGGNLGDGVSEAPRIDWGSGYVLRECNPRTVSPSMVQVHCTYTKEVAETANSYPDGLVIACSAGITTVTWKGEIFVKFNNGTGSCGSDGIEFKKRDQYKKLVNVSRSAVGGFWIYQQKSHRWYNTLEIWVDGVHYETHEVLAKETPITAKKWTSTGGFAYPEDYLEEIILKSEKTGVTYPADLRWTVEDVNRLILSWCGIPVWTMEYGA